MANIAATEITEVRRIPLNAGPGKKLQILELDIPHTFVNGDDLAASVIAGCDSILAVLSFTMTSGGSAGVTTDTLHTQKLTIRPARHDAAAAPTDAGDVIDFPAGGTDSIDHLYITLLIESN